MSASLKASKELSYGERMRLGSLLALAALALFVGQAACFPVRRRVPDTDRVIVALKQRNVDQLEAILLDRSDPRYV